MKRYPPAARMLITATVFIAALLVAGTISEYGLPTDNSTLITFGILTIFGAITLYYPMRAARGQNPFSLVYIFVFAGAILLPVSWAMLMCLLIWVPTIPQRYRSGEPASWVIPLVNAAQLLMAAGLANAILLRTQSSELRSLDHLLWLSVAAFCFVAFQTLYLSVLGALERGVAWRDVDSLQIDSVLADLFQPFLGAVVAVLWLEHPSLIIVIGVLLALLYRMLRGMQLIRMAEIDPKTGLFTFRHFEEHLEGEFSRSKALGRPLSLIFADLDHFHRINSQYGHAAGDRVLHQVASLIQGYGGRIGIGARFGGEEFVLLLPGTDAEEATYMADQLREALEKARIELAPGQYINCTWSLGCATYPRDGATPAELVRAANEAVVRAKQHGRNRVWSANRSEPREEDVLFDRLPSTSPAGGAPQAAAGLQPIAEETQHSQSDPYTQVITAAVILAAVAELAWAVARIHPQTTQWVPLLLLALGAGFAQTIKIKVYKDGVPRSLSMAMAVTMATGAYLGVAEAIIVNLLAGTVHVMQLNRRDATKVALNLSMAVMAAAAGASPFYWLVLESQRGAFRVSGMVAILVGAAMYYAVNVGIMVLVVALSNRQNPAAVWRSSMAWATPHYMAVVIAGGFVGYFHAILGWVGSITLLGLVLLMRRSFEQQVSQMNVSLKTLQEAKDLLAHANWLEKKSMRELTEAVSTIIDVRDHSVFGHSRQVAHYAVHIAQELGIRETNELEEIRIAGLLHDLGKVGIPEAILGKPSRLTDEEYEVIKGHCSIGERILSEVDSLKRVARLVGGHHERYDGKGYPRGLGGEEIPLGARIIAVSDTMDCILTDRPYSKARSLSVALAELERCNGTQFDPAVVGAALRLAQKMPPDFFQNLYQNPTMALQKRQLA